MKNPLMKRVPRQIRESLGKYLGMFIILVCTIIIGSSFTVVMESVTYCIDHGNQLNRVEHGQFEVVDKITDHTRAYFKEHNMELVENFYVPVNGYNGNARILLFDQRKEMNLPAIFEGTLPKAANEIAIDRLFASENDIELGGEVKILGETYKVTGLVALPDYSSLFKSNSDLVMNTKDFGVAVLSGEGFQRFSDEDLNFRYSYRYDKKPEDEKVIREDVEDMMKELVSQGMTIQSFLTDENNQSINFIREDMGKDGPMVEIFVYILIAIIAFVFAVLTNNTIESEAAIIGTLRASGYTRHEIVRHYLTPTILIALLASVVGNILGYTIMLKPFSTIYYTSYSIPPIEPKFSVKAFILTTIVPVVIMIALNFIMLYRKLSLTPLRFLRRELKKEKKGGAMKLPEVSFLNRFRMRIIWQNKGMYFILFLGIFLSSFLLMFGTGMGPLMDYYVESIDETLPYNYQYVLKAPVESEKGEKVEVFELKTWHDLAKDDITVTAMGIEEDSEIFQFGTLPEKKTEAFVSRPFAKKLNIEVGDQIVLKNKSYGKEYKIKVKGICDYSASLGIFMKRECLNELLENEKDTFNCYVSNEKLPIREEYVAKYITREDMIGAARQMMTSFNDVILLLNIFSVAVYMVIIYILSKTVIEKNAVSISFLKVFGYNDREINKVYLNATTIVVIVSLVICIPIEIAFFKFALVYLSALIEGYVEFYLPPYIYAMIVFIGIVAYLAINTFHVFRIRKIPMSIALKNRE